MSGVPATIFSHIFSGTVWNTLAVEADDLLFIETRDDVNFQVKFSVLNYRTNGFLVKDVLLPESWWVSMTAARNHTLLLHRYVNKGNPDRKNLIAFDVASQSIRWEADNFSFYGWDDHVVSGYRPGDDLVPVTLSVTTGEVVEQPFMEFRQDGPVHERPVFYPEGSPHFETVKKFLDRTDYAITGGVEYLEHDRWILMSVYVTEAGNLANYLLVFDQMGNLALNVKLGEKLTGLGADTFFILSGCLFLVKNKTELVAYRL